MKTNIRTNEKAIVLHCQLWRYRYEYDATGRVLPAIQENIGNPYTIPATVSDLDSETVGQAIVAAAIDHRISNIEYVYKVTHNGRDIPFSFDFFPAFAMDWAESRYGPTC